MVEITYEEIKDIRIMMGHLIKDYQQLSRDMKALSDSLQPVMVKLQIEEEGTLKCGT